jgi:hypothetical protein
MSILVLWVVTPFGLAGRHRRFGGTYRMYHLKRNPTTIQYNRVLLEKLIAAQLVKKFRAFYETRRSITVFKRACHQSIS